ncbi:hypothetical protein F5887DRAFT_923100 [Amanita rubescens]|nr:hypothetical protein F5887DRAFT_923100 [Amanita rubescens]
MPTGFKQWSLCCSFLMLGEGSLNGPKPNPKGAALILKRDGEEGEVHEGEGILTAEKKRRIEESQEVAYSDVNLKAVVHHLDICMFASDKLPWYPEGLTPEMDKVLCFHWDQDSSHDDNFHSIHMLVCYLCQQGSQPLPAAAQALAVVSKVDLEKRVVVQKMLRQGTLSHMHCYI